MTVFRRFLAAVNGGNELDEVSRRGGSGGNSGGSIEKVSTISLSLTLSLSLCLSTSDFFVGRENNEDEVFIGKYLGSVGSVWTLAG